MTKKNKKYNKPQIYAKKIRINYFLTNVSWIDQFNIMGDVYAQYGDGGYGDGGYGCGDSGYGCS